MRINNNNAIYARAPIIVLKYYAQNKKKNVVCIQNYIQNQQQYNKNYFMTIITENDVKVNQKIYIKHK